MCDVLQEAAYRTLCDKGANVSIVICGESGAGKTETTKHVLRFLSCVASATERKHSHELPYFCGLLLVVGVLLTEYGFIHAQPTPCLS